uniref:CSON001568 protein n=1 Tax=Culicoides sonorensis TaxID=179676 RepID=A0A336K8Y2_CULSO
MSINNRIVNGIDTDISQVPYQAYILRKGFPQCGAVILNEKTVISVGYCFDIEEIDPSEFQVRVGTSDHILQLLKMFFMKQVIIILSASLILGIFSMSINNRIVNGIDTDISQVPYQAYILRKGFPQCGAVILNEKTVISVGYCFDIEEIDPSEFQVRVGTSDRNEGGSVANVAEIILHPNLETDPLTNNLAIVKLATPLTFNENVKSIALPEPNIVISPNSLATVSGFGLYDEEEELYPEKLQSGTVTIVGPTICTEAYAQLFPVKNQHLCSTGDISPCSGDEGSPLVQDNKLIGVVSFGFDCQNSKYPTIYVRISEFRDFIDGNLN